MRRKTLAAILLPIPFAALPVVAVVVGAMFGGAHGNDELLTRESTVTTVGDQLSATDNGASSTLAKASESPQLEPGCGDAGFTDF